MEDSREQPRPRPEPPPLTGGREALEYLLAIEYERLEVAVRIERERAIVFPETTIIIRDIQKLMAALGLKEEEPAVVEAERPADDVDDLLRELRS